MNAGPRCVAPETVLIAGGGLVGGTLALALARASVPLTLLDASGPGAAPSSGELRPIALAAASVRMLRTLGVWPRIAPSAAAIRTVHVSESGRFGMVRLRAEEHGVDALGYVSDAGSIAKALDEALADHPSIVRIRPARIESAAGDDDAATVGFRRDDASQTLRARLVVAADGDASIVREAFGIGVTRREYDQSALVCNVETERSHDDVAYERFTPTGPIALLPLADGRCGLVWTLPDDLAEVLAGLDERAFLESLQRAFGWRLGAMRAAGERLRFPLARVSSDAIVQRRLAVIGNAANRLHPVAGQGLNLGLRDAATLADVVADAVRRDVDPGDAELLAGYARSRRADHRTLARVTDTLALRFAGPATGPLRSAGMLAVDLLPFASRMLARRAMGLAARQPRLIRGLAP